MSVFRDDQVQMLGISKSFGGVKALDSVNFSARFGEIHGLMGENGAGKSTLMKILSGAHLCDSGEIFLNGGQVQITDPHSAHEYGISVIYQEFALAQDVSVAENIFLENLGCGKRTICWSKLRKDASVLLEQLGFGEIDVSKPVSSLSVAYRQVVEICKAFSGKSKVFVLDEPTAVLTNNEVEKLFSLIQRLKTQGVCVIYISHRLDEIFQLCDRITILKDGKLVNTFDASSLDEHSLTTHMIGRELDSLFPERTPEFGEVALEVKGIQAGKQVKDFSLTVRKGEVLGVSGLVGAGRTESLRAVFGADKKESGVILIEGEPVSIKNPKQAVAAGIGMLPEDRKMHGVLLDLSIKINGTLSCLGKVSTRAGRIKKSSENSVVSELIKKLAVKTASAESAASSLSGGNQQKVALMKWIASDCKILFLDEPTRGVDVGAKTEIYKVINTLAQQGVAIVMVSSEMPEIIGMSDRVIVMREGRVSGELVGDQVNEKSLIALSMGVNSI